MLASTHVGAQSPCSGDSLALQVAVTTDAWGYEAYWELLPLNGACGSDEAMLWGGNPDVGCADGVPGLPAEVYGNNGVFVSDVACVAAGDSLTLFHRDSYGDGGTDFIVLVGGIELGVYDGTGGGNEWTFAAMAPEVVLADAPCFHRPLRQTGNIGLVPTSMPQRPPWKLDLQAWVVEPLEDGAKEACPTRFGLPGRCPPMEGFTAFPRATN